MKVLSSINTERPLEAFRSIKVKLGILVAASVCAAALIAEAGDRAGVPAWVTIPVTVAAALAVTQWLARGMTSPLRAMTAATSVMATGDYSRRVETNSVDEVGELARAFNAMAAELAASDQQRRQLVATVSHELRTPLTAQQALLENLADGVVSPDSAALHTALAQAERLSALVSDLLDLSRVDGGLTRLHLVPVDVEAIVGQGVAEAKAGGADRRGIEFTVDVDEGLETVSADAGRLAQVIANLLDNAVRHSPPEGVVSVRADRLNGDRWVLEVQDQGPGIPPDRTEGVFTRFGSWTESGGSTGLGLAIATWVCELHGGSIAVAPSESGALLRAVLPINPAPAMAPAKKEPDRTSKEKQIMQPVTSPQAPPQPPNPIYANPDAPVDSLFGGFWPETDGRVRPGVVLAALSVGLLAAIIYPLRSNVGISDIFVLLAAGITVLTVAKRRSERWTLVLTAMCLALGSFVALRAAEWVSVIAIFVVLILTMSGLTGARSVPGMIGSFFSWGLAAIRGLPLLGRTMSAISRHSVLWPVVRTAAISLLLLVVFGGLFASGDAVFGSWADQVVPDINADGFVQRVFIGFFVGGVVLAATYVAINPPNVDKLTLGDGKPLARNWEWQVPLGFVIAVFAAFVVAQATAMWGGHNYVQETTGLTYAEYVHQGFGQLTAATFLTLVTVAIISRKAPRDNTVLRGGIGLLGLLALAVVASALYRMDVYQEAYGWTILRMLVDAFELWMGLILVFVIVTRVIQTSSAWLPRAALLSGAAFVLVIGAVNPEAWVAQQNIDRYAETGKLDVAYLQQLGDDATPTIVEGLPRNIAECIVTKREPASTWLDWTLGRERAVEATKNFPPERGFVQACYDLRLNAE